MPAPNDAAEWMDASAAAARLGVSRATLYAYVSRGRLRAHPLPDDGTGGRGRRYRRSEVERLAAVHAAARQPRRVAVQALDWGLPVLDSGLTLIERGRFFYRGEDVLRLAETATLEQAAALLWTGDAAAMPLAAPALPADAALRAALRAAAAMPLAPGIAAALAALLSRQSALAQPAQLMQLMVSAVARRAVPPRAQAAPLHRQLRVAFGLPAAGDDLLRRALVLCADHELNASSFTVRCVAATGADLGACLTAGLAALSGPRHGGMTARVEALWPRVQAATPRSALKRWLQNEIERRLQRRRARGLGRIAGDLIPGFGHPLYPDGDPRAAALLALLPPDPKRERFSELVLELCGQQPALDFALVALRHHLGADEALPFAIFALARSAGWIAHAIEQQQAGTLIRPRARYVGERPAGAAPTTAPPGRVIRRR